MIYSSVFTVAADSGNIYNVEIPWMSFIDKTIFYLMSRGLTKEDATQMIIMGFIEPFSKELPMEYAVELNQLLKLQMKGSIG